MQSCTPVIVGVDEVLGNPFSGQVSDESRDLSHGRSGVTVHGWSLKDRAREPIGIAKAKLRDNLAPKGIADQSRSVDPDASHPGAEHLRKSR